MLIATLVCQLSLFLFHQATTLFDFFPFNNVRSYSLGERLTECSVNGALMIIPFVGFAFRIEWMEIAALVVYPALLVGEYFNWWHPYFFGPTDAWQKTYDRLFRNTVVLLPPIENHPVPNLEHTLLHSLTLLTSIVTYIAYFTAL